MSTVCQLSHFQNDIHLVRLLLDTSYSKVKTLKPNEADPDIYYSTPMRQGQKVRSPKPSRQGQSYGLFRGRAKKVPSRRAFLLGKTLQLKKVRKDGDESESEDEEEEEEEEKDEEESMEVEEEEELPEIEGKNCVVEGPST